MAIEPLYVEHDATADASEAAEIVVVPVVLHAWPGKIVSTGVQWPSGTIRKCT